MSTPATLPDWFLPLTRYRFGLGARPVTAPKPAPDWCLQEWHQFELWNAWKNSGGRRPPVWTRVPPWAWTIRGELLRQHPVPAPLPKPVPAPTFPVVPSKTKGRNGLYFYTYDNAAIGEAQVIQLAKQYNLWVALLTHELGRAPDPAHDTDATRRRLQGEGITVVSSGWADSEYDLASQAEAAAHYSQGFDEYLLNAEASWAWVTGPSAGFSAMGEFAPLLRAKLGPAMPLSLSCMWGQVTWLKPLLEAGLSTVRPQCYLNQYGHMDPAVAIDHLGWDQGDLKGGIPAHMVEPTYGKYGGFMASLSSWTAADNAARAKGSRGRSVWAAEFCDAADVAWIGRRG